ncbi:MAG: O-antigen ligase family protein, partial [Myxococcota bacterium]
MRSLSLTPWCVFAGVLCLGFPHHLAALGLRVAFIGLLAWLLSKSTRRCRHIFVLCVALSLPLVSIGLFSSERLIVGLDRWATVAGFSVAFLAASSAPDETRAQVLTGLFWAAAAQSIWAMLEAILTGSRASAGFFNPNHLGAWLLIVGTSAGLDKRPWFSLLCAGGVVATGSRSALIALLLITLVFLLQQKKGRLMVGAIGVAGAAVATLPSIRNRFIGVGDAYAFDRLQIWATALRAGWLEPWGWGLGDARIPLRILGVPLQHGEVRYPKVATQAHSEWLEWWIEFGLLGVVLLAVVLVAVAALPKSIGKLPLLVAVSVPASFGASLRAPLIAFTAAIVLANVATAETDPLPRKHKVALVLLAALAVVATAPASLARLAR